MNLRTIWLIALGILSLSGGDPAFSITCTECRELQKQRSEVQVELARKERDLDRAVTRKDFRRISELRTEVNQLRSQLLNMLGRDQECAVACRPDVIKEAECLRLLEEIAGLESATADDTGKDASKNVKGEVAGGDSGKTSEAKSAEQSPSASSIAKIDELYADLARCHKELKRLKEIHQK